MEPMQSTGLLQLVEKLKKTKVALWVWNKHTFGMADQHIKALEERMNSLEFQLQENFD